MILSQKKIIFVRCLFYEERAKVETYRILFVLVAGQDTTLTSTTVGSFEPISCNKPGGG